jgi:RNA polymerase sigma factor (sigma-70 family)
MCPGEDGSISESPVSEQESRVIELVRLLCDHPQEGVPLLLRRYGGIIDRLVHRFSHSPQDREDLYQEVVLKLLEEGGRRLGRWEPGRAPFVYYLSLVIWQMCCRCRRKMDRVRHSDSRGGNGSRPATIAGQRRMEPPGQRGQAAFSEGLDRLNECFGALIEAGAAREEDRLLVRMRAEGYPAKEVGDLLGLEEDLVNLRYSRVRRRLLRCLERHGIKSIADLVIDFEGGTDY